MTSHVKHSKKNEDMNSGIKMSRNASMTHITHSKTGASLRNISQCSTIKKSKGKYDNRRKSFGSLKMVKGQFRMPTAIQSQTSKSRTAKRMNRISSKRISSNYASILNDSTSQGQEYFGEYTYGKGGSSFAKQRKISKFDEDRERIYSPGPGRYQPRVSANSGMFSFKKEKKDFSLVQKGHKDLPSPGKYRVKRDFVSRAYQKK